MLNHNCSGKVEGETLAPHITLIEDAAASLHPLAASVFLVVCSMYACVTFSVKALDVMLLQQGADAGAHC